MKFTEATNYTQFADGIPFGDKPQESGRNSGVGTNKNTEQNGG